MILNYSKAFPVDAPRVFDNVHVGKGANSIHDPGLGVEASLSADSIWRLRFDAVPIVPAGTAYLKMKTIADLETGAAKYNIKWALVAIGEEPGAATLADEGEVTETWATGEDDVYKSTETALDGNTIVEDKDIVIDIVFNTTGWTAADVTTWMPVIVWRE